MSDTALCVIDVRPAVNSTQPNSFLPQAGSVVARLPVGDTEVFGALVVALETLPVAGQVLAPGLAEGLVAAASEAVGAALAVLLVAAVEAAEGGAVADPPRNIEETIIIMLSLV